MKKFRRTLVMTMAFILCLTVFAQAATQASAQIASYAMNAGAYSTGEILVDFAITGCGNMKKIGAEKIESYDLNYSSVTPVKTFTEDDAGMSVENFYTHVNTIHYWGIVGHRYKVVVAVFAEDYAGESDSRSKTFTFTIS